MGSLNSGSEVDAKAVASRPGPSEGSIGQEGGSRRVDSLVAGGCPIHRGNTGDKLPVHNGGEGLPPLPNLPETLSAEREVSSIPRSDGRGNWVYPSQQQFFSALKRKQYNADAKDMTTIIPIHNAVNEKAWLEILKWEAGWGAEKCGGPKLVRFEGDSTKLTPRARFNMFLGNVRPFDRHDWLVDRCGKQVEYVLDFYTGSPDPLQPERPSFYLDVRPKLNSWEGIKMRAWSLFR